MSLDGLVGVFAADAAIEKTQGQITFINFANQCREKNIMSYKPNCMKTWTGSPKPTITTLEEKGCYNVLYDVLVDENIIEKKRSKASFFTWDYKYTITPTKSLLTAEHLKKVIEANTTRDFQQIKDCFTIDSTKLSAFLTTYVNDPTKGILGGRRRKTRRVRKMIKTRRARGG
jgi:hypothetical protein